MLQGNAFATASVNPVQGHGEPLDTVEAGANLQISEFHLEANRLFVLGAMHPEGLEQPDGAYRKSDGLLL